MEDEFTPTEEQRIIFDALVSTAGSPLRDVHQAAVEIEGSPFDYSPRHGEGWNDERWTVRKHLHRFRDLGFARVGENPYPWYPTQKGREFFLD